MLLPIIRVLARPWVVAAGGSIAAYVLYRKNRDTGDRLHDAKLELAEQQRTIDRLRGELGRERHQREEKSLDGSY
ncbi:MAG: hypothetical protein JKY65_22065 [Planctomycetes bacterium]|nr:hypothetical protein [Planctomycetota bacterium]